MTSILNFFSSHLTTTFPPAIRLQRVRDVLGPDVDRRRHAVADFILVFHQQLVLEAKPFMTSSALDRKSAAALVLILSSNSFRAGGSKYSTSHSASIMKIVAHGRNRNRPTPAASPDASDDSMTTASFGSAMFDR